jgi:RNA polymerase sigma factor (sigma-70 family)
MANNDNNKLFEFFAAEGRNLRRYVRRRLHSISEMDAEDIIGDVMLKLFTRTEQPGPLDNPAAYVYRSLHNRIVDFERRASRTVSLEDFLDEDGELRLLGLITDDSTSVSGQVEQRELILKLGQAIGRLEPKQRAVLIATELDGASFKELSQRWNEPIGTLLSRNSRAVKALREMLKDYITTN